MKEFLDPLRNRNIALLVVGRLISTSGDWIYTIGLMLAIFQYSGGRAFLIGLFWFVRLTPNLVIGPLSGALVDRIGYRRAMIGADLSRLVLVAILAFIIGPTTWGLIYPIAVLVVAGNTVFNPASVGIIPQLVPSTGERLQANAVIGQAASLAAILGSAVGGLAAGIGYRELLLIDAGTFAVSALCLAFLDVGRGQQPESGEDEEEAESDEKSGLVAGFKQLASRPVLIFIAALMSMPELVSGALPVWLVPYTHQVLHLAASGAAYLYTALGVGAVVGGFVASRVGASIRLDALLAGSVAVTGAALLLFGLVPVAVLALFFLAVLGLAEAVEYAAYETLLQQAVPASMIGQAAGTMESYYYDLFVIGTLVAGLLAPLLGLPFSIALFSLLIILATGGAWWYLRVRTAGQPNALELGSVPAFQTVSLDVREWAVRRMQRLDVPAGAVVIRQGDIGDMFYTIARGQAAVEVAGEGTVTHNTLTRGDFFGEIALLQNVPRTATVRAETDLILWGLTREDFDELQGRASEFRESLEEVASARLSRRPSAAIPLVTRA